MTCADAGKSAYLTNANLILVLEELAEGKEEKLQTCLRPPCNPFLW